LRSRGTPGARVEIPRSPLIELQWRPALYHARENGATRRACHSVELAQQSEGITPPRGLTLAPGGAILARALGGRRAVGGWDTDRPCMAGSTATVNPDGVKNQLEGSIVQTTIPL